MSNLVNMMDLFLGFILMGMAFAMGMYFAQAIGRWIEKKIKKKND